MWAEMENLDPGREVMTPNFHPSLSSCCQVVVVVVVITVCVCVFEVGGAQCTYGGQRTTCSGWFFTCAGGSVLCHPQLHKEFTDSLQHKSVPK